MTLVDIPLRRRLSLGMVRALEQPRTASPERAAAGARPSAAAGVLFTAFEPSGDDHAASVIAQFRLLRPDVPVYAWGGPKMERAGATLIERTGDDAVMGLPGLAKIREHQRINQRIEQWLRTTPVALHVPVDSPAANFPICELTRAAGCTIVHLVAPQIWAWGRWRIRKLRRLTDLVLCLLPFEERFFSKRRVPAQFIGHVLFDHPVDGPELDRLAASFLHGRHKLAIMPGSRPAELKRNFPLILDMFRELRSLHPGSVGMIAATTPQVEQTLREMAQSWMRQSGLPHGENRDWPEGLACVVGQTDAVVRWCDIALVKSGTVTLQVAKQLKPMVIFYRKANPVTYFLARSILSTKHFSLPNVLAHRRIVPEFVPHFGGPGPIVRAASVLLSSPEAAAKQRAELEQVLAQFADKHASRAAAEAIAARFALAASPG
ncbi:MAG: hypothetical protein SFZ23_06980 [Planctomycetota bacterium]|nr:hypothetical protein [Planctomycetota bacterium]